MQHSNVSPQGSALTSSQHWVRSAIMVLMWFILVYFVLGAIMVTALVQWVMITFTGKPLSALVPFADSLQRYAGQVISFLTFRSEQRPFPFSSWPG